MLEERREDSCCQRKCYCTAAKPVSSEVKDYGSTVLITVIISNQSHWASAFDNDVKRAAPRTAAQHAAAVKERVWRFVFRVESGTTPKLHCMWSQCHQPNPLNAMV